jgi:uncharacterized membrane protein
MEYLGQTAFGWWLIVTMACGAGLLAQAVLLLVELRRHVAAQAQPLPPGVLPPPKPKAVLGLPAYLASGLAGVLCVGGTATLVAAGTKAHGAALAWTLFWTLVALWFFYRKVFGFLSRPRMGWLLALRVAGIASLLLLLFEPVLGLTKPPGPGDGRPRLAIVIDASGSMSTIDEANEPTRYRQSVLAVQNVLAPRLSELYDIAYFAYDGKHNQALPAGGGGGGAAAFDGLAPIGESTDLLTAVSLGTSAGADKVVLFSDGIHNGPESLGAASISAQVFAVKVGSSSIELGTVPDIAVAGIEGPQTATVNNQITLTAVIKSTAMSDRTIRVFLKRVRNPEVTGAAAGGGAGGADEVLDEQRLVLHSGPLPQTVALKFTPDKVGRAVVRVQVPVDPIERNEANNQQDFPILVTDTKLAVLYIEGRVRPEVGPLRRALDQDPNINAISMVQTQAGKFDLRGVKQGDDLTGVPRTLAQWKRFRVVILGDLDAGVLNGQQLRDLAQAVKEGTGLLMIGGQHNFASGHWNTTPLADLLPVSLAPVSPSQVDAPFVPQLTAAGAAHPIFRNIAAYFGTADGKPALQAQPALLGCVGLAGAKAGATVLAVHPEAKINGQPAIVLAVENYAAARTAAFAADTTWRWNIGRAERKDSPYNRFWGQLVRYLAGQEDLAKKTGPSVTAMIPKERYEADEKIVLRCAVTDAQGQSTAYAQVTAKIKGPDGKTASLPMAAVQDQVGVYECQTESRHPGSYQVIFQGRKDNVALGQDASGYNVLQAAGEMDVLAANGANLQMLARNGGTYQELSGNAVRALADRLAELVGPTAQASKMSIPLYHGRGLFFVFIAALGLEWFYRRKWQLQ